MTPEEIGQVPKYEKVSYWWIVHFGTKLITIIYTHEYDQIHSDRMIVML